MVRKTQCLVPAFRLLALGLLLFFGHAGAYGQTLDELHKKALEEGGKLSFYGTLAQINAQIVLPAFEKRFPGIKVDHVDATADKLIARAMAEARGGRYLADVYQFNLENLGQANDQGLVVDRLPPEAAAYPANLKGSYYVATDLQFIIAAWNTTLVKKEEEPKQFEDFVQPKWKNRLIAEPRDVELLVGLKQKLGSEEKAVAILKQMAANNVEFHKGHSELAEFLVAGQGALCVTCYAHHFPIRMKKGAPLNFMLTEGIGNVIAVALAKNAPHPNTAWLWVRWVTSEEGQKAMALGGRIPAHPKVEPTDKVRPERIYALTVADYKEFPKYNKIWKEIFKLR
ncbi:MAG TPA: ABC transporter substrate-binding protein [Candidatus Binatia bacterium]|nr:ABC transporter substrate-binding protein [Candidatus Binatia bacterium]